MAVKREKDLFSQPEGGPVVIALPEEIDITNSPRLRETLLAVISRRPAVLVADMGATTFCDSSGMHAIVTAYRQAVGSGTDLRLVIRHPATRRVLELSGVDTVISIYPDLPAALSPRPGTASPSTGTGASAMAAPGTDAESASLTSIIERMRAGEPAVAIAQDTGATGEPGGGEPGGRGTW